MHYDVFNGDADGIIALLQLRLAEPKSSTLITGVKRDIQLLDKVPAQAGDSVTALDISPDMLALTQQVVDQQSLVNVQCKLGDATVLNDEQGRYHFAVANMVLHHVPAPKTIFEQVAGLLAENGSLLITDLCPHEQTWARESCGDLWLGFDPADLTAWAREAGLTEGPSQFLGLRNGFQIQFRLFHKP